MDLIVMGVAFEMANRLLPVGGQNIFVLACEPLMNLKQAVSHSVLFIAYESACSRSGDETHIGPWTSIEFGGRKSLGGQLQAVLASCSREGGKGHTEAQAPVIETC